MIGWVEIAWIGSALMVGWIFIGYPLWVAARRARPLQPADMSDIRCEVVIAAHNESLQLPRKLRALLRDPGESAIDRVWIGVDAADDGTVEALRTLHDPRIRVWRSDRRIGKSAVLNQLLPRCSAEVIVLTDARQLLAPGALSTLLSTFADAQVTVASGELVFLDETTGSPSARGMGAYWHYEKFIRRHESRTGSVPGATGAFYALRREAVTRLPEDTLLDDVALPMAALQAREGRCIFVPGAVAWDRPSTSTSREAIRKRRTIAGVLQLAARHPGWWLRPGHPCAGAFLHHKVLRVTAPAWLVALLVLPFVRLPAGWAVGALAAQGAFYLCALVGGLPGWRVPKPLTICWMFLALNGTTVLAWRDWLSGRTRAAWDRSEKVGEV